MSELNQFPEPVKRAASSAVMGLETEYSPTKPVKGTQELDGLSKTLGGLSSSSGLESSTRPSGVTEYRRYGLSFISQDKMRDSRAEGYLKDNYRFALATLESKLALR